MNYKYVESPIALILKPSLGNIVDRVSKKVRSKIMASVGTKNTCAEMVVRRLVHKMGYRYSLHRADLPGSPDLVFPSRKKVIFVHGCFWHGHNCRYGKLPKSRQNYWKQKIGKNRLRDNKQCRELSRQGWGVLIVWQCQLRSPEVLIEKIDNFLENNE